MYPTPNNRLKNVFIALLVSCTLILTVTPAGAALSAADKLDMDAKHVLEKLYATVPAAKTLAKKSKGILVFPKVLKAGLMVGGQYGKGVLLINDKTQGYYNTVAGSYGFQIGAQSFGFVMFMMTDEAVKYLNKSEGWEIGVGPTVVFVDKGAAKTLTTTTGKSDIFAFIFDQSGIMAGVGIQGSKITKINLK